jgi:transposase
MPNNKRNTYPLEFKTSAVKLAVESDQPVAQTARDLGVNINTIHNWIAKYSNYGKNNQNNMTNKENSFEENKRLRKELEMVKQERDLLKKAAAYFAKESR